MDYNHANGPATGTVDATPVGAANWVAPSGRVLRGIMICQPTAADVQLKLAEDSSFILLEDLAPGVIHPMQVKEIDDTNTTATKIIGFY